jgi:hypothetical protein
MWFRHEIIRLRRGQQELVIRRAAGTPSAGFVGMINGQDCVWSPTREGAVGALLRRTAYRAMR